MVLCIERNHVERRVSNLFQTHDMFVVAVLGDHSCYLYSLTLPLNAKSLMTRYRVWRAPSIQVDMRWSERFLFIVREHFLDSHVTFSSHRIPTNTSVSL